MVKARPTIFQSPRAVIAIAHYRAKNEVIAGIRAEGLKPQAFAFSDIMRLAKDYVIQHPELIAEAKSICAEAHARELMKRERQRQRRAIQKRLAQAQSNSSTTPMSANAEIGHSEIGR